MATTFKEKVSAGFTRTGQEVKKKLNKTDAAATYERIDRLGDLAYKDLITAEEVHPEFLPSMKGPQGDQGFGFYGGYVRLDTTLEQWKLYGKIGSTFSWTCDTTNVRVGDFGIVTGMVTDLGHTGASIFFKVEAVTSTGVNGLTVGFLTGERGFTFTPAVSDDGTLSWTNNGGMTNPASKNIRGYSYVQVDLDDEYGAPKPYAEWLAVLGVGFVKAKDVSDVRVNDIVTFVGYANDTQMFIMAYGTVSNVNQDTNGLTFKRLDYFVTVPGAKGEDGKDGNKVRYVIPQEGYLAQKWKTWKDLAATTGVSMSFRADKEYLEDVNADDIVVAKANVTDKADAFVLVYFSVKSIAFPAGESYGTLTGKIFGVICSGVDGDNGVTFTPSVDEDGNLTWANNAGLENPASVNIKGPAGPAGGVQTVNGVAPDENGNVEIEVGGGGSGDGIPRTGNRGELAGWETWTFDNMSFDGVARVNQSYPDVSLGMSAIAESLANDVPTVEGDLISISTWTKVVVLFNMGDSAVVLEDGWFWKDGVVPTFDTLGLLVFHKTPFHDGVFGFVSYVSMLNE